MVLLTAGVSFAMFTSSRSGNKENVILTGTISVDFQESNQITLTDEYPESDAEGILETGITFTVIVETPPGHTVYYAIALDEITEGTTLTEEYINLYLLKGNTVASNFTEGVGKSIGEVKQYGVKNLVNNYVIYSDSFTGDGSQTFTLKAWVDESYNLPTTITGEGTNSHSGSTTGETFSFKLRLYARDELITITNDVIDPTVQVTVISGDNTATLQSELQDNIGVVGWQVTTSSDIPTSGWTTITSTTDTTVNQTVTSAGTYYVWTTDASGNANYDAVTLSLKTNNSCNCAYTCDSTTGYKVEERSISGTENCSGYSCDYNYSCNYDATATTVNTTTCNSASYQVYCKKYTSYSTSSACTSACSSGTCMLASDSTYHCSTKYTSTWNSGSSCSSGDNITSSATCPSGYEKRSSSGNYYCFKCTAYATTTAYSCPNGGTVSGTTCIKTCAGTTTCYNTCATFGTTTTTYDTTCTGATAGSSYYNSSDWTTQCTDQTIYRTKLIGTQTWNDYSNTNCNENSNCEGRQACWLSE